MSEEFYGLKRKPFRAPASGADVFVGPQTAKVMQSTKKGLAAPDAVVAVIGPAGTGKTTLVKRALGTVSGDKQIIHIARMQLGHDQVLELLLDAVGATDIPASTLKQFRLFQKLCIERATSGVRTVIVVEDAVRIGDDALAELEALTAADGHEHPGANLVLMGDPSLGKLLHTESLVRLRQRLRLYQKVQPLADTEMQGYLKHCFRLAGGEFDLIFEDGAAQLFHALSGGVPRIVNNLVDSVLADAAEKKLEKIDTGTIRRIADDEYGLTVESPAATSPAGAPNAASLAANEGPAGTADRKPVPQANRIPQAGPATAAPRQTTPPTAAEANAPGTNDDAADARAGTPAEAADEVPELIQDTLPDLAILAPGMAGKPSGSTHEDDDIPTLFSSQKVDARPAPEKQANAPADRQTTAGTRSQPSAAAAQSPNAAGPSPQASASPPPTPSQAAPSAPQQTQPRADAKNVDDDRPDWDRDPTLAELKPDIDALERAMASFAEPEPDTGGKSEAPAAAAPEPAPEIELRDPTMPALPEITLDTAIEESIAEATAARDKPGGPRPGDDVPIEAAVAADNGGDAGGPPPETPANAKAPAPAPAGPPANESQNKGVAADDEIDKIAAGLSRAKTIEDVDDRMAETLFGEEFSAIAARIAANPPKEYLDATGDSPPSPPPPGPGPGPAPQPGPDPDPPPGPEPTPPKSALEKEFMEVYGDDALDVSIESDTRQPGFDLSASQRLATVRALNAGSTASAQAEKSPAASSAPATPPPDPIEDQITTSLTQTIKTLQVNSLSANDDDDDDEKGRGFFSRFRRS